MRVGMCLLVWFAVAVSLVATTAAADPYVCGDTNGDGMTNITDVVFILDYVFDSGNAPNPMLSGDAEGNGTVEITDAVFLIQWIFNDGPPPVCECGYLVDIDGNAYMTVRIGDRCWMAQDLNVTHYRNGDQIPRVNDPAIWPSLRSGAFCEYDTVSASAETYGRLYNFYAVFDSRGIAPEDWHLPSDDEWKQLEMYLGMSPSEADTNGWRGTDEGGKLKEIGTTHWNLPNEGASNETGFTSLPGGMRIYDGSFVGLGDIAVFWSSTDIKGYGAWDRALHFEYSAISRAFFGREGGASVRCVRDLPNPNSRSRQQP